jgi:hypothetical protein
MSEPTSLPWATEPDDREGMEWNVHIVEAARPNMRICFMSRGTDSEAHADYLVKACNAFPEAVTLLNALLGLEKGSGEAAAAFVERHADLVGNFAPVKAPAKGE